MKAESCEVGAKTAGGDLPFSLTLEEGFLDLRVQILQTCGRWGLKQQAGNLGREVEAKS